ncbi:MAG: hypothetical protein UT63_C0083G0010 [Candidatus Gottesmanbacteria bacterium GW2011_GWC2_39_8]|uniref:PIN domain-containing protein n=1 Tax=Candidatus Gottesmanbacteria bacterium GW2011_GWC2_39_8 TaxID=1618450 RepID=A0A0G0S8P4_9BACT|nr:MAG: hypothetical protein UT63_C0083G0010 [Candidatus Gottesmanbacteria bacterium GW2011_GWC2_39_8]
MIFVDTNYFLRFLLADNDKQHLIAKKIFTEAANGKNQLTTSIIVLFEIYWVLSSFYGKEKTEIAKVLKNLLEMKFIEIPDRSIFSDAVEIYSTNRLDLEDSFNLIFAKSQKTTSFKTFDRNLENEFKKRKI